MHGSHICTSVMSLTIELPFQNHAKNQAREVLKLLSQYQGYIYMSETFLYDRDIKQKISENAVEKWGIVSYQGFHGADAQHFDSLYPCKA